MVVGSSTITATGNINLGNATLNITGYIARDKEDGGTFKANEANTQTLIVAGTGGTGGLTGFNPVVTVNGQPIAEFLDATVFQVGNEIKVETRLNKEDVAIAAGNSFTLGNIGNHADGTRTLTKTGAGTLILTGNNTYTGLTTVAGGTLIVDSGAKVAGAVTVNSGATLGGYGTIDGLITMKSGGILSPGSSIGSLTATSGITFEKGSKYLFEIDKNNAKHDLLTVSNGTITIQSGALLDIVFLNGSEAEGDAFQVIAAANGVKFHDNTLFTIHNTLGTVFQQQIRDDGYWVSWQHVTPQFAAMVQHTATPNALNAAKGMDQIVAAGLTDGIAGLYAALLSIEAHGDGGFEFAQVHAASFDAYENGGLGDGSTPVHATSSGSHGDGGLGEKLAQKLAQLHAEVYATSQVATVNMQRRFTNALPSAGDRRAIHQQRTSGLIRANSSRPTVSDWYRWGLVSGEWVERRNVGGFSNYNLQTLGVVVGLDRKITRNMFLGGAVGYDTVLQNFETIRSSNRVDALRTMLYGGWHHHNSFVDSYVGYTKNWHNPERKIDINHFSGVAKSKYDDDLLSVGIVAGHRFFLGETHLLPSIGLHYIRLSTPSITETGARYANLYIEKSDYESLRMPIGARWIREFTFGRGIVFAPELRAFYIGELADTSAQVWTSFVGDRGRHRFAAGSGAWGRSTGRVGVGFVSRIGDRVSFRLDYDYETCQHMATHEFGTTLGVSW